MAQSLPVQHSLKGTLNLDTDPANIQQGNYCDAKNVQFIGRGVEGTLPISPVLRNELMTSMGAVASQRKLVRVFFDLNTPYVFRFLSPGGGGQLRNSALSSGIVIQDIGLNQPSYAAAASFLQGVLQNTYSFSSSVVAGSNFIEIDLVGAFQLDWSVVSVGANQFTTEIRREAIPLNYTGTLSLVGGYDLLGDLFLFSTPQERLPSEISGCSVISGPGGLVQIAFPSPHGLSNGDEIFIQDGSNDVNGYWLVNVINPSNVSLRFSSFVAGGLCTVVLDRRGVGEIGVAVQDNATKAWTYTRLLRSVEFGFSTLRQVEVQAEVKPIGKAFYFHQVKYNPPRVFYYVGDYVTDGAISFVNNDNRYVYGSIFNQLSNQQNILEGTLEFVSQEGGGSVRPGNKQYFLRMVGQEGALFTTEPFAFTGLVNVSVAAPSGDPQAIAGGEGNISSGRVNLLRATGLRNDLYESVELCVVEWFGDAFTASVVRREILSGSEITLRHTGTEATTPLPTSELNLAYPKIKNIGSERIVDNRLVYMDIDYAIDKDLSDWAETITHRIFKYPTTTTGEVQAFQFGNYLDPRETVRFLGYSWYETHRFGLRVYWRDGGRSRVYWIDDIKFDISPTNVSLPNRRTGAPANYDLRGTGGNDVTFVPAVEFALNMDFQVDGRPIRELISRIEFMRVDLNDNPAFREVLFSGMGVVGWLGFWQQGSTRFGRKRWLTGTSGPPDRTRFPFPFFSGQGFFDLSLASPAPPYLNMVNTTGTANTNQRDQYSLFIVSNDVLFGGNAPIFEPGDRIINFGRPRAFDGVPFDLNVPLDNYGNFIRDFSLEDLGVNPSGGAKGVQPHLHGILGASLCARNSSVPLSHYDDVLGSIIGTTFHTNAGSTNSNAPVTDLLASPSNEFESCFVVSLNNPMVTPLATPANPTGQPVANYGNTDEGVYYVSYYRERFYDPNNPDNSKFGSREETVYATTANFLDVSPNQFGLVGVSVFGGDTFVSRVQHKIWNHLDNQAPGDDYLGGTYAMSFVSQSYVNPLMRVVGDVDPLGPGAFPQKPLGRYDLWLANRLADQTFYNRAYSYQKFVQERNYREPRVDEERFPTLVIWSDLGPSGSLLDAYRNFLPLNRKELDRIFGRIVHAEVVNNELFILQERKWQREFFNTTGLVSASPDDAIALGNTGVLARKGVGLSAYGTRHKWSAIRGRLASGADCVCWMDAENGTIVRYGGDGTRSISFPSGVDQFFKENSQWVFEHDTPAAGLGICGVWNERFKEFRWAVRGFRRPDIDPWTARVNIPVGATVRVPGSGYEPVRLKECILAHESDSTNNPVTGVNRDFVWRDVLLTDGRHYNIYSIVYSEAKSGFTTFLEPVPRVMLPWRADYVTQKYGDFNNRPLFLENSGLDGWYDVDGTPLIADGFIEAVINYNSDQIKQFTALYVDCELVPYRVEFTTPEQESFLVDTDFTYREGVWVSPIKNDILTSATGSNEDDTTRLYGRWIKVKIWFESGKMQTLRNFRVRLEFSARYVQT